MYIGINTYVCKYNISLWLLKNILMQFQTCLFVLLLKLHWHSARFGISNIIPKKKRNIKQQTTYFFKNTLMYCFNMIFYSNFTKKFKINFKYSLKFNYTTIYHILFGLLLPWVTPLTHLIKSVIWWKLIAFEIPCRTSCHRLETSVALGGQSSNSNM